MAIASMPVGDQALRRGAHLVRIERHQHVAVAVHALGHLQAVAARHQRVGELQEQVVDVVALLGAHLQDVAEAARGDQAEAGAAALDQRVGDQGGAVDDHRRCRRASARPLRSSSVEALQRADRRDRRAWSGICAGGFPSRRASSRMKSVKVPPMSKPIR